MANEEDECLCRPIGFLLGLPFMLLSALLSIVGIIIWIIATLLICIFPCGVCLAAIVSFAICLIKLPLRSLEAAIFLYSRVCQCPTDSRVLPAICTNDRLRLGVELQVKHASTTLPSPIKRIFYMSCERVDLLHEVFPIVNSAVVEQLHQVDAIVYRTGSLYTSICPSLVLCGVGENIASRTCPKVLIVNGSHDRETLGMFVSDFVLSVCDALNCKLCNDSKYTLQNLGDIPLDCDKLEALHIMTVIVVDSIVDADVGTIFQPQSLITALHDVIQSAYPVIED